MDFRILGSLEAWDGERQLELGGPKRRAVLAFLLLHANEVVAVDRLVDQLWGEKAPRNATAALHTHVSRLRKELGPDIVARRDWGYVLRAEPGELDLERFERLVSEAENLPAPERAEKLREALALWRGPALEDLAFEPALAGDIARLDALHLTVIENRIDADLEAGGHAGLVGELEMLIAHHPLRERLRGQLILALYRSGRQAEALEAYRETRRVLAEELGLDPSLELQELERAILQHDPALQANLGSADVAAQPSVPSGPRRRIVLGASLALLLAGLGTAAAYAVSSHTTQSVSGRSTSGTGNQRKTTGGTTGRRVTTTSDRSTKTTRTAKTTKTTKTTKSNGKSGNGTTGPPPPPTTVVSNSGGSHHGRKRVTISDSFGTDYVKRTIWTSTMLGGSVYVQQQGGELQLTIEANAVPDDRYNRIDVHVATQCSFPGNFDARVEYKLLQWPAGDNINVGMNAGSGAVMRHYGSQSGDEYVSWVGQHNQSLQFSGSSGGSLRIRRVSGVETTYYWHGGGWQELTSSRQVGSAVIALQAVSDGQDAFGGELLEVAFDNFRVTGVNPSCPSGARPPRS
jgi:DNA-binding SARP family transcriptional activator